MVIFTILSGTHRPQHVASHQGETLPTFGRAPYLPWQDSLAPSLDAALTYTPFQAGWVWVKLKPLTGRPVL